MLWNFTSKKCNASSPVSYFQQKMAVFSTAESSCSSLCSYILILTLPSIDDIFFVLYFIFILFPMKWKNYDESI